MCVLNFDPQAARGISDLEDLLRLEREKEKDVVVDKEASGVSFLILCVQCLEVLFPFQTEEDISSLTPYKTDLEYLDDHFQVGNMQE